jgi:hypothetical protein
MTTKMAANATPKPDRFIPGDPLTSTPREIVAAALFSLYQSGCSTRRQEFISDTKKIFTKACPHIDNLHRREQCPGSRQQRAAPDQAGFFVMGAAG